MKYIIQNLRSWFIRLSFQKSFTLLLAFGMMAVLFSGCSSSTSSNGDEDGDIDKNPQTFNLILSGDNSTEIGVANTELLTENDDAYIDDGFFITLEISGSNFEPPYDISMTHSSGQCGTWDVQDGEKAEMPCDYDTFLSDPSAVTITSEDGSGVEAYLVE